jgi:putative transposase
MDNGPELVSQALQRFCENKTGKHEHNHRHRHSALGYRTPAEYAAACRHIHTPAACEIN